MGLGRLTALPLTTPPLMTFAGVTWADAPPQLTHMANMNARACEDRNNSFHLGFPSED